MAWLRNLSTAKAEEPNTYSGHTHQVEHDMSHSHEISRLLTAAVVNHKFSHLLLNDPRAALISGYNGESFQLSPEETKLIMSIKASSLRDFASQVVAKTESLLTPEADGDERTQNVRKSRATEQFAFSS
jgi:hypothetical protein